MRRHSFWSIYACRLGLMCVVASPTLAQESGGTKVTTQPVDPKALMFLASKSNGLTGPDLKPWHLKATFQLVDDSGNATDTGTYEEFWVGPKKFKLAFTGKAWARTDYGTEGGVLRSGGAPDVPALVVAARREFLEPLPDQKIIDKVSFKLEPINADGAKLSCLRMTSPTYDPGLTYCFAPDQPVLRISDNAQGSTQVLHNRILKFQDHFIAGDLKFVRVGKPVLTVRIDTLESLKPGDEAEFAPPQDAKPVPKTIDVSAAVTQGLLLKKTAPVYPPYAESTGISGTVVLESLISESGHIRSLRVLSGPGELQQAALDAVRTWVYKPYLLNGEPVEVKTIINVVFTLHR